MKIEESCLSRLCLVVEGREYTMVEDWEEVLTLPDGREEVVSSPQIFLFSKIQDIYDHKIEIKVKLNFDQKNFDENKFI